MANERLLEWLDRAIADRETNVKAVASSAGIGDYIITRWRNDGRSPKPEHVRALAHALNKPVLEAFIEAGFLTADDTDRVVEIGRPLTAHDDHALLREIRRRLEKQGGTPGMLQRRYEQEKAEDPPANVVRLDHWGGKDAPRPEVNDDQAAASTRVTQLKKFLDELKVSLRGVADQIEKQVGK